MEQKLERKLTAPPYLSYRTFRNWLEGQKAGTHARIDRTVLRNMSGMIQSQLLSALRNLGLTDADGKPTQQLEKLSMSDGPERQKILREVLKSSYPFMFSEGFNLQTATPGMIKEQFEGAGVSGDTIRKCVSFFLFAARDAGLQLSPSVKTPRRVVRRGNGSQRVRRTSAAPTQEQDSIQDRNSLSAEPSSAMIKDLLAKFPPLDPAWPDDVKTKWFESFDRLMKTIQGGT